MTAAEKDPLAPPKARSARFRVRGRFAQAGAAKAATVAIDPRTGLFSVRPLHRHHEYTLPLSTVAEIVVARLIKADLVLHRKHGRNGRPRSRFSPGYVVPLMVQVRHEGRPPIDSARLLPHGGA